MSPTLTYAPPTRTLRLRDNTSTWTSTSSPPPGHKPITPLLSGSICGGILGIAWLFTLVWYLYRRRKRVKKERLVEAGVSKPPPRRQDDKYIIPPDPAVLEGQKEPGTRVTEHDLTEGGSNQPEAGPSASGPPPVFDEKVSDLSVGGNVTKRDYVPPRKPTTTYHSNDPPHIPSGP